MMKSLVQDPKILVIDDHLPTRMLISSLLQRMGYDNIRLARDGIDALAELKKDKYNLILSDWNMPDMDGLTLWGKIREDDVLKNIPFILITGVNEIDMIKKAISEGVTNYIVKPITVQALTDKVAKALGTKPNS